MTVFLLVDHSPDFVEYHGHNKYSPGMYYDSENDDGSAYDSNLFDKYEVFVNKLEDCVDIVNPNAYGESCYPCFGINVHATSMQIIDTIYQHADHAENITTMYDKVNKFIFESIGIDKLIRKHKYTRDVVYSHIHGKSEYEIVKAAVSKFIQNPTFVCINVYVAPSNTDNAINSSNGQTHIIDLADSADAIKQNVINIAKIYFPDLDEKLTAQEADEPVVNKSNEPASEEEYDEQTVPKPIILRTTSTPTQPVVKTQLLSAVSNTADTISSQRKGAISEDAVIELLYSVNNKFEINKTSHTGHLADIHVIDHEHKIKYIVEVKFKQNITRNDITKFESDVNSISSSDDGFNIIGLFLSLNTDRIVGIGKYSITPNIIYLSESYVTRDTLEVLFNMVIITQTIRRGIKVPASTPVSVVKYTIPSNVVDLIVKLRVEYASIAKEREVYDSILKNAQSTVNDTFYLKSRLDIREEFIKLIDNEFKSALPNEMVSVTDKEEQRLRNYIKRQGKKVTKKAILQEFPMLASMLGSMKKDNILQRYG